MRWLLVLAGALSIGCSRDASAPRAEENASARKPVVVPERYRVLLETTKGPVTLEVVREWAPRGADRFYELVRTQFYDGARIYRVRPKFVAQFGISADPKSNELWRQLKMPDDPVKQSNLRGFVSFAAEGNASRTTQVFINLADNKKLDKTGFAPFARVVDGMDAVDAFHPGYGEVQALGGAGPDAAKLETLGDEYAVRSYPRLDQIKTARIIE